ncbi:V-type proton ATPase subunit H-like [Paramacrobiotus metropolitanus]|uniref:V-type proton ATPase subunit H-like n=1 Tax=Paramacrobiotus metropolitanus TaxID=2943436 RepID=UPI002445C1C2|nr:V-type proton ATPase subunit H-like [Paramacrobiotus metropolitanus]
MNSFAGKLKKIRERSQSPGRALSPERKAGLTGRGTSVLPSHVASGSLSPTQNRKLEPVRKISQEFNQKLWIRPTLAADTEVIEDVKEGKMPISAFSQKRAEIRERKINWGAYLQSGLITQEQFDVIINVDKYSPEKRGWIFRDQGVFVAECFIELLNNISKDDTIQYLLTLIDDSLEQDRTRIGGLNIYAENQAVTVASLFIPFLNRTDLYIMHQTARIIAKCACWSASLMEEPDLSSYLVFLKLILRSSNNEYKETTVRCLQMMLRIREYRLAFLQNDGITGIVNALNANASNSQLQYQLIFCLWCLTFDADVAKEFLSHNVVPIMGKILTDCQKEKVIRITLAILRNLLEKCDDDPEVLKELGICMVHARIIRSLEHIEKRRLVDPDLLEDVEYLVTALHKAAEHISSFDEYMAELKSGSLEWSPAHKSETFWRENAARFSEANYELLKILVYLMQRSKEPLVLSVAVHDIGQYVRFSPRGKAIIDKVGGKEAAMALLSHADADVRYQALLAVQKMMVTNWEFLGKKSEKDQNQQEVSVKS